jgi:hypothetical protein
MAAKRTYLELINKVLKRISQSVVTEIPTIGHASIVAELINEGQNYLYTESGWHSLYTTRMWKTYQYTASTVSFDSGGTINDSADGLGTFTPGCMVHVTGSDGNSRVFQVDTVAVGTLTLTSDEVVTTEAAGSAITITQVTYATATDLGRCLSLQDETNNTFLGEDVIREFDMASPQQNTTGSPIAFAIDGDFYRLYPVPGGVYTLREHYIKTPTALSATTDTSELPIECENVLIHYAYYQMLEYLQRYDAADRERMEYARQLGRAKASNDKIIRYQHRFSAVKTNASGIAAPRFPSSYGVQR